MAKESKISIVEYDSEHYLADYDSDMEDIVRRRSIKKKRKTTYSKEFASNAAQCQRYGQLSCDNKWMGSSEEDNKIVADIAGTSRKCPKRSGSLSSKAKCKVKPGCPLSTVKPRCQRPKTKPRCSKPNMKYHSPEPKKRSQCPQSKMQSRCSLLKVKPSYSQLDSEVEDERSMNFFSWVFSKKKSKCPKRKSKINGKPNLKTIKKR